MRPAGVVVVWCAYNEEDEEEEAGGGGGRDATAALVSKWGLGSERDDCGREEVADVDWVSEDESIGGGVGGSCGKGAGSAGEAGNVT